MATIKVSRVIAFKQFFTEEYFLELHQQDLRLRLLNQTQIDQSSMLDHQLTN